MARAVGEVPRYSGELVVEDANKREAEAIASASPLSPPSSPGAQSGNQHLSYQFANSLKIGEKCFGDILESRHACHGWRVLSSNPRRKPWPVSKLLK